MISLYHNGVPEALFEMIRSDSSFDIRMDDNESQPHILVMYEPTSTDIRERSSVFTGEIPTDIICVFKEPTLKIISDVMSAGASLVVSESLSPVDFMQSIKTILSSNIYNAANRSKRWAGAVYRIREGYEYIPSNGTVYENGNPVKTLNPKEQQIMNMLCDNIGTYIPKKEFLSTIWGDTSVYKSRSFDVYINRLRHTIDVNGTTNLRKIRGSGYALICDGSNETIKNKY